MTRKDLTIPVLLTLCLTVTSIMVTSIDKFSSYAHAPEEAHAGDSIWIEPSFIDLSDMTPVGYKFNATVWINLTVSSAVWRFKLAYNKTQLNATGCGYTARDKSDFFSNISTVSSVPEFGSLDAAHDYVLHNESWSGGGPPRSPGYGGLSWVEFEVMSVPSEGETSPIAFVDVYPDGTETYAQEPDKTKIVLNAYDAVPEFSGLLFIVSIIGLAIIATLLRKLLMRAQIREDYRTNSCRTTISEHTR